jgi:hypothetical protein
MARQRQQTGQLIEEHDRWSARWREDVKQPDGSVKRVRRWDVIAPRKGITRRMAEKILADRLREINGQAVDTSPIDHWLKAIGVELCDSCRGRLLAALQAKQNFTPDGTRPAAHASLSPRRSI